jgi:hypothetical protein
MHLPSSVLVARVSLEDNLYTPGRNSLPLRQALRHCAATGEWGQQASTMCVYLSRPLPGNRVRLEYQDVVKKMFYSIALAVTE